MKENEDLEVVAVPAKKLHKIIIKDKLQTNSY